MNKVRNIVLILVLLTLALLLCILTRADSGCAWKSDFSGDNLKAWQPYGAGTEIKIDNDSETGEKMLAAKFDDSTTGQWCTKGAICQIKPEIQWNAFKYMSFSYKVSNIYSNIGVLIHDKDGNWWRAISTASLDVNSWLSCEFKKGDFAFGWNDNAEIKEGKKQSDFVEIYISVNTQSINTKAVYELMLKNVCFGDDSIKTATAANQVSEKSDFPLQWKATNINSNGYLIVDKKPFFPLGLYSCIGIDKASATHKECKYVGDVTDAINNARFKAVKDAGFNMLQSYTMQFYGTEVTKAGWEGTPDDIIKRTNPELVREGTIKFMDLCQKVGLKALVGGSQPYCIGGPLPTNPAERAAALDKMKQELKDNVSAWKNHPALVAWYLIDEPQMGKVPVNDLTEVYQYMKTLDISHPLFIASSHDTDTKYKFATDIMGPDPYPLNRKIAINTLSKHIDAIKSVQTGSPAKPQLWPVIQIGLWFDNGTPLPTTEQMRLLAMLALTRDVKGFMFFDHENYPDRDPAQWKRISLMVHSLHSVIPDILASTALVDKHKVSDDRIDSILRYTPASKSKKQYYTMIAANATEDADYNPVSIGKVTFDFPKLRLPAGSVVTVIDEDSNGNFKLGSKRFIKLVKKGDSYSFSDNFSGLASHVYKIGLKDTK